jgi:hypothetical protein
MNVDIVATHWRLIRGIQHKVRHPQHLFTFAIIAVSQRISVLEGNNILAQRLGELCLIYRRRR